MRKAFTLIEVNLAMLIMAGGILSIVGLYAFGFRESRQGREDVAASALADAVVSPLVMAASATNLQWSVFKNIESFPSKQGWGDYIDDTTGVVKENPDAKAKSTYSGFVSALKGAAKGTLQVPEFPQSALNKSGLMCGLVVIHKRDSAVLTIAFRATDKAGGLMSMPLFFTQVRFQGIIDQ